MAQPYNFDEASSTFPFEESSFQGAEISDPFDAAYDEYLLDGSTWPSTNSNEHIASVMPLAYQELIFPIDQSGPQPAWNQASIPYQGLSPYLQDVRPDLQSPYASIHDYIVTLEAPEVLPSHSKIPTVPMQCVPVEDSSVIDETIPAHKPKRPIVALRWEPDDLTTSNRDEVEPIKKRKTRISTPISGPDRVDTGDAILSSTQTSSTRSLEEYMGLFDTTLQVTKERRRRKVFSAQERKAVKSVRNVGACIQCRFRKKTCSAGHPCPYCARLAGSHILGTQMCQRESPFIGRSLTQYYSTSSRKRIIDFKLSTINLVGPSQVVFIIGAGDINHPLAIEAVEIDMRKLELNDGGNILRTKEPKCGVSYDTESLSQTAKLIKPGSLSAKDLEDWAIEYASSYSKTKLRNANGFVFGTEYVKKGLPHSDIVDKITRLVAINHVLRVGIAFLPDTTSDTQEHKTSFRTVQAQIDTLLFKSFTTIEKSLYSDLQRFIFRSAGSLARDAIIPVCFSVWQLTRLQCMLASHLTNLASHDLKRNSRSPVSAPNSHGTRYSEAQNLTHGLNLLLCTFQALFRTACPLLLDWTDLFNKELLCNDPDLLALATKMGRTLRYYRVKGHRRKFKMGFGYDKEMSANLRGLLQER